MIAPLRMKIFVRARIFLFISLLGFAPSALAQGTVCLRWDACLGAGGPFTKTPSCDWETFSVVASIVPGSTVAFNSFEATLDVVANPGPLADFWDFTPGGCNEMSVSYPENTGCPRVSGANSGYIGVFRPVTPWQGNPGVSRLEVVGLTYANTSLAPNAEYSLFRLDIENPGDCAGCDQPIVIVLREVILYDCAGVRTVLPSPPAPIASITACPSPHAISIDATALAGTQFSIDGGPCMDASGVQELQLGECGHVFQTCSGPCQDFTRFEFTVTPSGAVEYAAELEGSLSGSGTPALTVLDCVPTSVAPPGSTVAAGILSIQPNPAPGPATIRYAVAVSGPARLAVYDLLGRSVDVLVDEALLAGVHVASWDGRDARGVVVPSGVYFACVTSGGAARMKRLVIMN